MLDVTTIVQAAEGVLALVVTGLLTTYLPKGIAAFEARSGIVLTENQRQTMLGAAQTAAGTLETMLDQGAMKIEHINVRNPTLLSYAETAIRSVPVAARALGVTQDSVARIIVGMVDTAAHPPLPPAIVASPAEPPV